MGAERAQALVASAEAEAEAVRRSAGEVRAAAREEGQAEGLRAAEAELVERLAVLGEAHRRWQARLEAEALDLAVEMARRIVGRELRADPAVAAEGALQAIRAAGSRRALRVRLHPETVGLVRARAPALVEEAGGAAPELLADPSLSPGDVVVETEAGLVDGRVDSRLESLRAALEPATA
jgi:flagellar biosynthesis/type III secretory pathway protein FliH